VFASIRPATAVATGFYFILDGGDANRPFGVPGSRAERTFR
jgi:hypothetical protein